MPYPDERAGLAAIRAIVDSVEFEEFRERLDPPTHSAVAEPWPPFAPCPPGSSRTHLVAIDGSQVYDSIPGRLPDTHAGAVSLGVVVIKLQELHKLDRLPQSGAVNPRDLRDTELGHSVGAMLPGTNARTVDGLGPQQWFRRCFNDLLSRLTLGTESFADTLCALLGTEHTITSCPNPDCEATRLPVPAPGSEGACPSCSTPLLTSDALRIHEQFDENHSSLECHMRVMQTLEMLALANSLRCLTESAAGLDALARTAFVMDGQLAAFGTIAVLAHAMRAEFGRIQSLLEADRPGAQLLVLSGVKSGPFVRHADELDRAPQPNRRIPTNHYWLPDNDYIRAHIVAGQANDSKPWGELTHYGRPLVLKTAAGQRLVLNLAQPEAAPPLTNRATPAVLADAIATAAPLGVGTDQFLALRRAHRWASIPLRAGVDLIRSLAG
ncbi:hypothetical protein [Candidatus Poriferisodalis multihospitum]|uniref:hypothetical protein n=1 Tax=Candidatus Poriferisodalis multihospitum TaxID=2983191 RepID=UPI002B259D7C|nr:hypothetical protein [Candidatus Poriferisodalis multihospitum]